MPRKPQEAPAVKPKRGHLFDKLGAPKKGTLKKVSSNLYLAANKSTKANGRWTPRKTGRPKGCVKVQPCLYTDESIREAIIKCGGLLTHAAKRLGMDNSTMSARVKKNPSLMEARVEAREAFIDKAEFVLGYHLDKKSLNAAFHVTRYLGRNRGYCEKQDVEQINGPVNLDAMTDDQLTQLVEAIGKKLEGK